MKKKLFTPLFIIILLAIFIITLKRNATIRNSSELSLAIIEALASFTESGTNITCWKDITNNGEGNQTHKTFCGECGPKLCRG